MGMTYSGVVVGPPQQRWLWGQTPFQSTYEQAMKVHHNTTHCQLNLENSRAVAFGYDHCIPCLLPVVHEVQDID